MRVTQSMMFTGFLSNLNDNLSKLMELNIQASSQKRINRPSDDPVGMARILDHRRVIGEISQYQSNIDTAKGWLGLADETLIQANSLITRAKELAEQAATGTLSADNREEISYEARQILQQMVSLANTTYEGQSIFAGHKVDQNAYETALMATSNKDDAVLAQYTASISGSTDKTVLVQFTGPTPGPVTIGTTNNIAYRYTTDGGKTWTNKTLAGVSTTLDLGGVSMEMRPGYQADLTDTTVAEGDTNGTWLYVMPTARYKGDDENQSAVTYTGGANTGYSVEPQGGFEHDVQVEVVTGTPGSGGAIAYRYSVDGGASWIPGAAGSFSTDPTSPDLIELPEGSLRLRGDGATAIDGHTFTVHAGDTPVMQMGANVNAWATGGFSKGQVAVRIDTATTVGAGGQVDFSYSLDGGRTWTTGQSAGNTGTTVDLVVPGGQIHLSARDVSDVLAAGAQFVVTPRTAGINVDISYKQSIQVNNVGKDIFGGLYAQGDLPVFSGDQSKNLFVAMGKLVGYLETNNQAGVQEVLENLRSCSVNVMNNAASVAGRENRLTIADNILSGLDLNEKERMSKIEDADISELLTQLSQQQIAYEAVLKTSSTIMRMSLVNYV